MWMRLRDERDDDTDPDNALFDNLPRLPGALHDVCQCDIVAPNIELPLSQTEHPAVNPDMEGNFGEKLTI